MVYSCKFHVVFCPKYLRKVLSEPLQARLMEVVRTVAEERRLDIIEMEVMPDHVHILHEVDPQFGIHRAVKRIKGTTSRVLRAEFPEHKRKLPSLWTHSYFVSTVGGAPLEIVKQYTTNQHEV
ncbi:MAG: IS200/IS605 family transposase [Gammaproteobacteria bacterium]|nr:IS200/IS605 family transposase [Gammaproteobacteria bacterium]NBT45887.1 IS200/IS605 family transposase [Gammaproteobacteria bacterium]NBY21340.1 IS200/IS605 family transposase [Gammaproteobacteria bacterium]